MPEENSSLDLSSLFRVEYLDYWTSKIMENALVKFLISGLMIILNYIFYTQKETLTVLFALIMIDSITGGMLALKQQQFSSAGFFRFANKMTVYLILMATACLVDRILPVQFSAMMMTTFLVVTEAISIMENLKKKGESVPWLWVTVLIRIKNKHVEPSSGSDTSPVREK